FASGDYIDFLENRTAFELIAEIDLPGSEREVRERFLIYRLPSAGNM
ncbi:MAG TPA: SAM-dependent methyltransferase, partial [Planococcus sp. (in: firmicutes)]|nr:SAM-dependent methyltransferase [Planococcus sp. (in: firmicutes)]